VYGIVTYDSRHTKYKLVTLAGHCKCESRCHYTVSVTINKSKFKVIMPHKARHETHYNNCHYLHTWWWCHKVSRTCTVKRSKIKVTKSTYRIPGKWTRTQHLMDSCTKSWSRATTISFRGQTVKCQGQEIITDESNLWKPAFMTSLSHAWGQILYTVFHTNGTIEKAHVTCIAVSSKFAIMH